MYWARNDIQICSSITSIIMVLGTVKPMSLTPITPLTLSVTLKNGPFPASFFLYFRLFNIVDRKQMFNLIFADGWIRTVDLWYRKQLLYQLSHNHCP